MPDISEDFVNSAAPNGAAIKNGKGLVIKKRLVKLRKSEDDSIIFGECMGSGASNYQCSADFVDESKPVYRCSCPSRQFPCKHVLGLMYAFTGGAPFAVAEVPEDLASKRGKAIARAEKKATKADEPEKPRKVDMKALRKKIDAQLDGLTLLEKLTADLVRGGLGNLNPKTAKQIEEQAKQLGNSYIPGAQKALRALTLLFYDPAKDEDEKATTARREKIYSEALDVLTRLHAIVKRGRQYLESRKADDNLAPDVETDIAAWLGHAWQLRELKELGQYEENVDLIQLAFNTYDDKARQEFVDRGYWISLKSGAVDCTLNYRPYRAAKFVNQDDCFFEVAQVGELYLYPGDMNRRVRWDANKRRPIGKPDYAALKKLAKPAFADVIKNVKNQLMSPLGNKNPVAFVRFAGVGTVDNDLVVEDAAGDRLVLENLVVNDEPPTCHLLKALGTTDLKDQAMLIRFGHDLDTRRLVAKPVTIVTDEKIIRLEY